MRYIWNVVTNNSDAKNLSCENVLKHLLSLNSSCCIKETYHVFPALTPVSKYQNLVQNFTFCIFLPRWKTRTKKKMCLFLFIAQFSFNLIISSWVFNVIKNTKSSCTLALRYLYYDKQLVLRWCGKLRVRKGTRMYESISFASKLWDFCMKNYFKRTKFVVFNVLFYHLY